MRTSRCLRMAPVLAAVVVGATSSAAAQTLSVVSWNVESGGAAPSAIAPRIRAFGSVDVWGFSEVQDDSWAAAFETAAEDGESADFKRILGTTGGGDRLAIVYDGTRFEELRHFELTEINLDGNVRAPLVAELRERSTGQKFLFMVNHLYRSRADRRLQQAAMLNQWARSQALPVIAVGDYNFDWAVGNGDTNHDPGYDNMTADAAWAWVRPDALVRSQCSEHDSVLDFVFVTEAARAWPATSTIVIEAGDCPDGPSTPDHRPVAAVFTMQPAGNLKAQILARVQALEAELAQLKALVQQLP
jgi:endonuclease/exonuclease/phosphatase family metal-dependent hydrolase